MIHAHQEAFPHSVASGCFFIYHRQSIEKWIRWGGVNTVWKTQNFGAVSWVLERWHSSPSHTWRRRLTCSNCSSLKLNKQSLSILSTHTLEPTGQRAPTPLAFAECARSSVVSSVCLSRLLSSMGRRGNIQAPDGWVQFFRGPRPRSEQWPVAGRSQSAVKPRPTTAAIAHDHRGARTGPRSPQRLWEEAKKKISGIEAALELRGRGSDWKRTMHCGLGVEAGQAWVARL